MKSRNNQMLHNFKLIKQELKQLSNSVNLIAVSKAFLAEDIELLYNAGQHAFAENYFTEFKTKTLQLAHLDIEWHFIGTLQSNKLKYIANTAKWVHSLEKAHHAIKLNQYIAEATHQSGMPFQLNVLIEVNISDEPDKHGVKTLDNVMKLAQVISQQPYLQFRGLMGVASHTSNITVQMNQFIKLSNMFHQLKQKYDQEYGFTSIDTISMGMSNDYTAAIKCGATMVRIGSKIFGARK